ncbi:MAG: thioredoxin family protein [Planctomycetes bacterium]|nr:thioredoxin family protein [Planctomycetota bacterium]
MPAVRELTDADFKTAVSKGVVVVDFYGTYCPPCKTLEPVMDQLADDFDGKAMVAKINIDEHSEAAVDNSVEDIPTIILFKDGVEAERLFGAQKLETLTEELNRLIT